jgi:hypothetical protein
LNSPLSGRTSAKEQLGTRDTFAAAGGTPLEVALRCTNLEAIDAPMMENYLFISIKIDEVRVNFLFYCAV